MQHTRPVERREKVSSECASSQKRPLENLEGLQSKPLYFLLDLVYLSSEISIVLRCVAGMSYSDDESKESAGSSPAPFRPIIPDVSHIDMNKLSRQPEGPDFIPYNKRGRDIMSRTFQFTGICWLGGFSAGGVLGFMEGWRKAVNPSLKIRINSVMNNISRRGSFLANNLAVVAFMHTFVTYTCEEIDLPGRTGVDWSTPVVSGFVTGGIFKSTQSVRACAVAATIGAVASTTYHYVGDTLYGLLFSRRRR